MIRVGLFLLSAVSLACLAFTSGWPGFILAVLGFAPLIVLIVMWSVPADRADCAHMQNDLSRLDRLDGLGETK